MTRHSRAVLQAPCKLNLALDITGVTGDGYHLLDGVMLAADLCDLVVLALRDDGALCLSCNIPGVPTGPENLAHKAARVFFDYTGLPAGGLDIGIHKKIPMEAGLAGGSADAAAVLAGLCHLYGWEANSSSLLEMSLEVGADVYFCLTGGCARTQGKGELLTPLPLPGDCVLVIAKPPSGMSTREAFDRYDRMAPAHGRPNTAALVAALAAGDLAAVGGEMANVFEGVCPPEDLARIKGTMLSGGALGAAMSGTGTAVAGLFPGREEAAACRDALGGRYPQTFLARPVDHGPRILFAD